MPVYEANLRALVRRLSDTGAKLIWASMTPIPAEAHGRVEGSEVAYNAAAAQVMREHGIPITDLHALVDPNWERVPGDVHFTPGQSTVLAEAVAKAIQSALIGK